jgi:hypothetical protein
MSAIDRALQIVGRLFVGLGLAALAFALLASGPIFLGGLGDHTYLRLVPAPWWQSTVIGLFFLAVGAYLMVRSRSRGRSQGR